MPFRDRFNGHLDRRPGCLGALDERGVHACLDIERKAVIQRGVVTGVRDVAPVFSTAVRTSSYVSKGSIRHCTPHREMA